MIKPETSALSLLVLSLLTRKDFFLPRNGPHIETPCDAVDIYNTECLFHNKRRSEFVRAVFSLVFSSICFAAEGEGTMYPPTKAYGLTFRHLVLCQSWRPPFRKSSLVPATHDPNHALLSGSSSLSFNSSFPLALPSPFSWMVHGRVWR